MNRLPWFSEAKDRAICRSKQLVQCPVEQDKEKMLQSKLQSPEHHHVNKISFSSPQSSSLLTPEHLLAPQHSQLLTTRSPSHLSIQQNIHSKHSKSRLPSHQITILHQEEMSDQQLLQLSHSQELEELKSMPMHYQDVLLPSAQQIQAQTIKQIQPHFNELSHVQLDQNTQCNMETVGGTVASVGNNYTDAPLSFFSAGADSPFNIPWRGFVCTALLSASPTANQTYIYMVSNSHTQNQV